VSKKKVLKVFLKYGVNDAPSITRIKTVSTVEKNYVLKKSQTMQLKNTFNFCFFSSASSKKKESSLKGVFLFILG
jgi:ribosomal protein S8